MDFPELTKLAFSRVQKVEPENVGKILGCILLREPDEEEMVQLAYGSDAELLSVIADAKATLAAIYARCSAQQRHQIGTHRGAGAVYHPVGGVHHFSPTATAFGFHAQSHYWPADSVPPPAAAVKVQQADYPPHAMLVDPTVLEGHYAFQNHNVVDDHHYDAVGGYYYATAEDTFHHGCLGGGLQPRASCRRPNGLSTRRPCHYFFKGICKNGQNCHYSHRHQVTSDSLGDEDHHNNTTTPAVLEALELEITELLNSRRGQPVSIASLPTLYGEKYGKGLQADGYLTESQRHGKAGYSLTKLLSRLNKIRVIERPHGQHAVVLAEDAARYTHSRAGRGGGDMGSIPASSHQIYLTFPAESIFTEEDVANYFGQYGPVRDVRIPCQERRMFGFVSFQSPDTVSTILMRRNPHFICGSRVLVKPYREKSKCIESHPRTSVDKIKPMQYYPATRFCEVDPEFYPEYDASSRLMRKQLAEKRERLIELELERKRFAGIRFESLPPQFAYFDCSIEDVHPLNSLPEDSKDDDLMDHRIAVPDPLDIVSMSQAPQWQTSNNYDEQKSNQIELLPESPFASTAPAGNNVSAVI